MENWQELVVKTFHFSFLNLCLIRKNRQSPAGIKEELTFIFRSILLCPIIVRISDNWSKPANWNTSRLLSLKRNRVCWPKGSFQFINTSWLQRYYYSIYVFQCRIRITMMEWVPCPACSVIFVFFMLSLVAHVQNPCCLGGDWKRCPIHSIYAYYCMARHCMQSTEMCRHCVQFFGYLNYFSWQ